MSFEPTWKDAEIQKNPKYAAAAISQDFVLDITKLRRKKAGV
jgi:hypothetical protein